LIGRQFSNFRFWNPGEPAAETFCPDGERISGVWSVANPRDDTNSRSAAAEFVREAFELPRTDGASLKALNLPAVKPAWLTCTAAQTAAHPRLSGGADAAPLQCPVTLTSEILYHQGHYPLPSALDDTMARTNLRKNPGAPLRPSLLATVLLRIL